MKFLVKITLRDGQGKRFVAFDKKGYGMPRLVTTKQAAEKFNSRSSAQFCSDSFWQTWWNKEKYYCREICAVEELGKN